jgi:hypothetical protein
MIFRILPTNMVNPAGIVQWMRCATPDQRPHMLTIAKAMVPGYEFLADALVNKYDTTVRYEGEVVIIEIKDEGVQA